MGRFFKAQEVELSKDHIYQPPVELIFRLRLTRCTDGARVARLSEGTPFLYALC